MIQGDYEILSLLYKSERQFRVCGVSIRGKCPVWCWWLQEDVRPRLRHGGHGGAGGPAAVGGGRGGQPGQHQTVHHFTITHCFNTHKEILQGFDVVQAAAKAGLGEVLEIF